jgi:hypothetical protein
VNRCWAYKIGNVLDTDCAGSIRPPSQPTSNAVMNAATLPRLGPADRRLASRWQHYYPNPVARLRVDLEELLTCWRYKSFAEGKAVRTNNGIKRRLREVCRRAHPMGVFSDRTSIDASSSPSSTTKTKTRTSAPSPADANILTSPSRGACILATIRGRYFNRIQWRLW